MPMRDDLALLFRLLPSGRAFPLRNESSLVGKILRVISKELERFRIDLERLELEIDPRTATDLLPEWERLLGIPHCAGTLPATIEERRGLIVASYATRLSTPASLRRNVSPQAVVDAATDLGFSISVVEHDPLQDGPPNPFDDPGTEAFIVDIGNAQTGPVRLFRAGTSVAGDSLGAFGNEPLECLLERVLPAWINYRLLP